MTETDLMHMIMLKLSEQGNKVFRVNVGKVRTADGRIFSTGLPKGFSDLLIIRPDGIACFVECKVKPNKPTPEQIKFIDVMRKQNALAGVAYTVEEAIKIVTDG